jgi:hypothetical protein
MQDLCKSYARAIQEPHKSYARAMQELRKLCYEYGAFWGQPASNTRWQGFQGRHPFDPKRYHGRYLIGEDGLPVIQVWVHCDNFLLQSPVSLVTKICFLEMLPHLVMCRFFGGKEDNMNGQENK